MPRSWVGYVLRETGGQAGAMPATLLLTNELGDALADAVRHGVPIETAVQSAGISRQTFYEWLRVAESGSTTWSDGSPARSESLPAILAFSDKIRRAQADWEAEQVRAIRADAEAYNAKTGLRDWRARAFLLTNHPRTRKRWGQHVEVEQHSTVHHEHTLVKTLELEALEANLELLEQLPPASTNNT